MPTGVLEGLQAPPVFGVNVNESKHTDPAVGPSTAPVLDVQSSASVGAPRTSPATHLAAVAATDVVATAANVLDDAASAAAAATATAAVAAAAAYVYMFT